MNRRLFSRRATIPVLILTTVLLLATPWWAPPLLASVPWFDVQRVEVSGTRLLAPHEVMAAAGVTTGQSVWDDADDWAARLRSHPVIADATVERRLPSTLRIRIREEEPVAFVDEGDLRVITASGAVLPVDPAKSPLDLPIVRAADADSAETASRQPASTIRPRAEALAAAEIARLGRLDPQLVARVSEVRIRGPKQLGLVLSRPFAEISMPMGASPARLHQLRAVIADLEQRLGEEAIAPEKPAHVDLRYRNQIVVRLPSSL